MKHLLKTNTNESKLQERSAEWKKLQEVFLCTFVFSGYFLKISYAGILSSLEKQENYFSTLSLKR